MMQNSAAKIIEIFCVMRNTLVFLVVIKSKETLAQAPLISKGPLQKTIDDIKTLFFSLPWNVVLSMQSAANFCSSISLVKQL